MSQITKAIKGSKIAKIGIYMGNRVVDDTKRGFKKGKQPILAGMKRNE
jgi:hypothetical protein